MSTSPVASMSAAGPLRMTVVAAATMANGVGVGGGLPWRLKGEMAYFRQATSATSTNHGQDSRRNAVIMGRKTWESIPPKFRPLQGRVNIVIGRSQSAEQLGISDKEDSWLFPSIEEAVSHLKTRTGSSEPTPSDNGGSSKVDKVFLIGGAQLWAECLAAAAEPEQSQYVVDRLLLTRILQPDFPECDAFLPEIRDAEQLSEDLELASRRADTELAGPKALDHRVWLRASAEELRQYLLFPQQTGGKADLGDSVEEEAGVVYQFQMWTKGQF